MAGMAEIAGIIQLNAVGIFNSIMASLAVTYVTVEWTYDILDDIVTLIADLSSCSETSVDVNAEVREEAVDDATGGSADGAGTGGATPNPDDNGNKNDKDKKSPKDSNYRKHYKDQHPDMPDNYHVHHTLPQKYREILWKAGIFIDELMYLTGVDPNIHSKITTEWQRWDRWLGHIPTAEEIQEFSKYIEQIFGDFFFSLIFMGEQNHSLFIGIIKYFDYILRLVFS